MPGGSKRDVSACRERQGKISRASESRQLKMRQEKQMLEDVCDWKDESEDQEPAN